MAALHYAHPWDGLIARFKFGAALDLAPVLSQLLAEAVRGLSSAGPPHSAEHNDPQLQTPSPASSQTLLLPVPLSSNRLRERGYNQAWELARRVAATLKCTADAHLLLRVKETPHQTTLPPDARAANVRDAFAVEPLRAAEIRGREVALVDDVMTTGATLAELTRTMLNAGASRVQVWVLARTPRPER